jgi:hypothetical protein
MASDDDEVGLRAPRLVDNHARRSAKEQRRLDVTTRTGERSFHTGELRVDLLADLLVLGGVLPGRKIEVAIEELIDVEDFDVCRCGPWDRCDERASLFR